MPDIIHDLNLSQVSRTRVYFTFVCLTLNRFRNYSQLKRRQQLGASLSDGIRRNTEIFNFSVITLTIEKIRMENIETKNSSDSRLYFESICSIRILSFFRVMIENVKTFSKRIQRTDPPQRWRAVKVVVAWMVSTIKLARFVTFILGQFFHVSET